MRPAHPRILYLIAALSAAPSLAETVSYTQVPSTVAYRVASNNWSVTVRHPFRVIQVSGRNMQGELWFTPGNMKNGVRYNLSFSISSVPWPDPGLRWQVLHVLGDDVALSGATMDIIKGSEREGAETILETHPNVLLKKRTLFPGVRIQSTQDGRVLHWLFNTEFPLTDLGMWVPRLWGIPGENKVSVSGEMSFSPKD